MSNFIQVSEQTMLGDLMKCVIEQVKVLPKPWDALSENEQREYLDRVDLQVADAVRQAIQIISSQGHNMVPAKVDSVTYKDGCKVVLKALGGIEHTIHLAEAEGQIVNVIIPAGELMNDSGKPEADPDQRGLDLGHEYYEGAELDDGFIPGQDDIDDADDDFTDSPDLLFGAAVSYVRAENKVSVSSLQRHLRVGYNRAARMIEEMELRGIVSYTDGKGNRDVYPELDESNTGDGIDHSDEYKKDQAA